VCSHTGWIELGGCGMVDPNVLTAVGLDPEEWQGFAFGFGLERIAMIRWGIDEIRAFFENDMRFLARY
jgi:phenylalanyl-tRNA synthetase alpha chain